MIRVIYPPTYRATYQAALYLVADIDEDLATGRRHYRTKVGILLTTLDEVVRAILADDLVIGEASNVGPMTTEDYRRIMRVVYRQHRQRRIRRKSAIIKPPTIELLKETYCFIESYDALHRIKPGVREIGQALGLSKQGASLRLKRMESLGWIQRDRRPRSIVLLGMK